MEQRKQVIHPTGSADTKRSIRPDANPQAGAPVEFKDTLDIAQEKSRLKVYCGNCFVLIYLFGSVTMLKTRNTKKRSRPMPVQPQPTELVNALEGESNHGQSSIASTNNQLGTIYQLQQTHNPCTVYATVWGYIYPHQQSQKIHKGEFVNLGLLFLPPGTTPPRLSLAIVKQRDILF